MLTYNTMTHDRLRLFVDDVVAGDYHIPKKGGVIAYFRMLFQDLKELQQHGKVHGVVTVNGHGRRLTDDEVEAIVRWKLRHAEEDEIDRRRNMVKDLRGDK